MTPDEGRVTVGIWDALRLIRRAITTGTDPLPALDDLLARGPAALQARQRALEAVVTVANDVMAEIARLTHEVADAGQAGRLVGLHDRLEAAIDACEETP